VVGMGWKGVWKLYVEAKDVGEDGKEVNKDLFGESNGEVHEDAGDNDPNDGDKDCL